MLALAKLNQSEEVAGAGACASWERSTSKCERAPAALNQFAPVDPRHAARRSFRSLSGAQQRDYVNVFEGFIAKKEAKEVLGQAVKEHGGAEAVRNLFVLDANHERWLLANDFTHHWNPQRTAYAASEVAGDLGPAWVIPMYRDWLRWRASKGTRRKKTAAASASDKHFFVLELDYESAELTDVSKSRRRLLLQCHPDKTQHLSLAEREERALQFTAVHEAWEALQHPASLKLHRETCAQQPSNGDGEMCV